MRSAQKSSVRGSEGCKQYWMEDLSRLPKSASSSVNSAFAQACRINNMLSTAVNPQDKTTGSGVFGFRTSTTNETPPNKNRMISKVVVVLRTLYAFHCAYHSIDEILSEETDKDFKNENTILVFNKIANNTATCFGRAVR